MKVLLLLVLCLTVASAAVTDRTIHFGGSLSDNQEVVFLEEQSADFICNQTGFTEALFGRAAVPLFIDRETVFNLFQVGPLGLPKQLDNLLFYRLQFARYDATILPDLLNVAFPNISVPTLKQQIDQFEAISLASHVDIFGFELPYLKPTLITVLLGPNDLVSIFLQATKIPPSSVPQFFADSIDQVLTDPVNGLLTQLTRLTQLVPFAKLLVGNSPDLTQTPKFNRILGPFAPVFQGLIQGYNLALSNLLLQFPNAILFDLFTLLNQAIQEAPAPYNTTSCLSLCQRVPECVFADDFSASFSTNQIAAKKLAQLIE